MHDTFEIISEGKMHSSSLDWVLRKHTMSIVLTLLATRASNLHSVSKSTLIMQHLHAATVMTVNGESEEVFPGL